jgi:hypothetical protein
MPQLPAIPETVFVPVDHAHGASMSKTTQSQSIHLHSAKRVSHDREIPTVGAARHFALFNQRRCKVNFTSAVFLAF